ncbi:MAG: hypothetical protein DI539_20750 [Flavobacterium psychrophilum]|nr:MAG: hypothetical protein DI539_20750 [Flavobacterium psychrophilum]
MEYRLTQLLRLPVWLFGISFTLGTLLLLLNLFGDSDFREISFVLGFLYTATAIFINASIFTALIICSYIFKEDQNIIAQQAAILLINIPIAILYAYIVFNDPFGLTKHY